MRLLSNDLKIVGGRPSMPGALFTFRFLMAAQTSFSFIIESVISLLVLPDSLLTSVKIWGW